MFPPGGRLDWVEFNVKRLLSFYPRTKTMYNTGKHNKVLQVETPPGVVKVNPAVLQCVVVSSRPTRCELFVCYMPSKLMHDFSVSVALTWRR